MMIRKLQSKEKYCKRCKDLLDEDWMYDECADCMLDKQKKVKIVKGAIIGGTILGLASVAGTIAYKYKKRK